MKAWKFLALLASGTVLSGTAIAQSDAPPQRDEDQPEILVTGSRLRDESAQKTPIAVTVLSPKVIEGMHNVNITSLSSVVPNLTIQETGVAPGVPAISLRGFNTRTSDPATEPGVAVYVDGVYQTTINGSIVDLYDLDKIEVLRGPQGTLLGKNAGAGAILLTRSRPTGEFGGKAEAEYGRYNLVQVRGLVNFPIIPDVLAAKVFGSYRHRDSWEKNLNPGGRDLGGEDLASIRGALLFTPTPDIDVYLTADYIRDRSEQRGGRNISTPPDLGCNAAVVGPDLVPLLCGPHIGQRGVTGNGYTKSPKSDDNNITMNANWNLGGVKLTGITGYRNYRQTIEADLDHTALPILEAFNNYVGVKQISQELRLSSTDGGGLDMDGKLAWLIAGYLGHSKANSWQGLNAFGALSQQSERVVRDSQAIFGHADYKVTDAWTLSVGARHSWDKTEHLYSLRQPGIVVPPLSDTQSAKFQNTSFELGTQYQITDDHMIYVRYAEGYRGGGFIGFPGTAEAAALGGFGPETSESYEAGLKTQWFDGRLMFNVTLFDVKFKGMQRDVTLPGPNNTFVQTTTNAADATTKGIEVESIFRPAAGLTLRGNFGYLDAKYTSYNVFDPVSGNTIDLSSTPLAYAPKFTASGSADYKVPLNNTPLGFESLDFFVSYDWRSHFTESNTNHISGYQKAYGVAAASVTLGSEKGFSVTGYVDNIFDKRYITLGDDIGGLVAHAYDNIGITYGVKVGVKF
jgi:iron complex outermembrane receptor protein